MLSLFRPTGGSVESIHDRATINPQHENSLFNQISLFIETLNQPMRAIPICEEFIQRFPNSDKVPAVREQLGRAKGDGPVKCLKPREQRTPLRDGRCG